MELRGFSCGTEFSWCGTQEFLVWNRGILGAEKEWPLCVELMC